MKKLMINTALLIVSVYLVTMPAHITAHENTVIIPMFGKSIAKLKNIVYVAKSGGDYNNPVTAMASITDASISNPYLLVIAPGVYTLESQLIMKEYVDIKGSGQKVTILTGSNGYDGTSPIDIEEVFSFSSMVVGADNTKLQALSIENVNGDYFISVGVYNSNLSISIDGISIHVSGTNTFQYGILNDNFTVATVKNSNIHVSDSIRSQYGIWSVESAIDIINSDIEIDNAGNRQFGVISQDASKTTITQSRVNVYGGGLTSYGFFTFESSPNNIIRDSSIIATTTGSGDAFSLRPDISVNAKTTYISNTILKGSIDGGNVKCIFVFEESGGALDDDCDPPPP